ncbi:MAG: PDGLE domain-containing protein [Candidatus Hadarchaeales archaeon]
MRLRWWMVGLVVCLFMAGVLSLFASSSPDGLERVAEDHGFAEKAKEFLSSPFPDYSVPALGGALSTSLAGLLGVVLILLLTFFWAKALRKKK